MWSGLHCWRALQQIISALLLVMTIVLAAVGTEGQPDSLRGLRLETKRGRRLQQLLSAPGPLVHEWRVPQGAQLRVSGPGVLSSP